jgi:hypothetical protein
MILQALSEALGRPEPSRVGNELGRLDETSLLCEAHAGLRADELETRLSEHALCLAPLPPFARRRSLAELLTCPEPEEAGPFCGRFVESCVSLTARLADGSSFTTRTAPRKAVGPDFAYAVLDGRGSVAELESLVLRVHRCDGAHVVRRHIGRRFADALTACRAVRAILVGGLLPWNVWVTPGGVASFELQGMLDVVEAQSWVIESHGEQHDFIELPSQPPVKRSALRLDELDGVRGGWALGWHRRGLCRAELSPWV